MRQIVNSVNVGFYVTGEPELCKHVPHIIIKSKRSNYDIELTREQLLSLNKQLSAYIESSTDSNNTFVKSYSPCNNYWGTICDIDSRQDKYEGVVDHGGMKFEIKPNHNTTQEYSDIIQLVKETELKDDIKQI